MNPSIILQVSESLFMFPADAISYTLIFATHAATRAHTNEHSVCFPLTQFVFDMHAQPCPAPTSLREKTISRSSEGDKLTPAESGWTLATRHGKELAFRGNHTPVCSTVCHLCKYEEMESGHTPHSSLLNHDSLSFSYILVG